MTIALCAAWSGLAGYYAYNGTINSIYLQTLELLRNTAWLWFMGALLWIRFTQLNRSLTLQVLSLLAVASVVLGLALILEIGLSTDRLTGFLIGQNLIMVFVVTNLIGIIFVEQIYRNTPKKQRWAIKFFCMGVGGIFIYDFYLYTDALLFQRLDDSLWGARGYVNAMIVPMIAVSASRNPNWSLHVHVSKKFVFHSAVMTASGFYLITMAAGGYYLKIYGGSWGGLARVAFLFSAVLFFSTLIFSGKMRAWLKVFLNKNFFKYKYDYRDEWLRLIREMTKEQTDEQVRFNSIIALADIVESRSGMLWMADHVGNYRVESTWNLEHLHNIELSDSSLVKFLQDKQWVIDIEEYKLKPRVYSSLDLPDWLDELTDAYLTLPLIHQSFLLGFVVLGHSRVDMKINWEDRDLLLTASRQIASYLALLKTSNALLEAKQFDAFNRLSAYVVHDLKNLVAQLALIVSNAAKHKGNPEFMEDVIDTVENATTKMRRLLAHLRKGRMETGQQTKLNLGELLREVVLLREKDRPIPIFEYDDDNYTIVADHQRLGAIMEHMIQNAQEATPPDGFVHIKLSHKDSHNDNSAVIVIKDNGCGMDKDFVRERLFHPFQTTKGNAGMGIGVYESMELVTQMGGILNVSSELGQGTEFTIQLPLYTAE